jgi:hypothetical protein
VHIIQRNNGLSNGLSLHTIFRDLQENPGFNFLKERQNNQMKQMKKFGFALILGLLFQAHPAKVFAQTSGEICGALIGLNFLSDDEIDDIIGSMGAPVKGSQGLGFALALGSFGGGAPGSMGGGKGNPLSSEMKNLTPAQIEFAYLNTSKERSNLIKQTAGGALNTTEILK